MASKRLQSRICIGRPAGTTFLKMRWLFMMKNSMKLRCFLKDAAADEIECSIRDPDSGVGMIRHTIRLTE